MESIYIQTKVRGQVSLELALEEMKERSLHDNLPFFYTAGSDMYDCFHERFGA